MKVSDDFQERMSASARRGEKVVYHGTWSEQAPHTYGPPVHAGTARSAEDRLFSDEGIPEDGGHFQAVHAYAINEDDIDTTMYKDPHSRAGGDTPHLPDDPENIKQYVNAHEDAGNVSYLVPQSKLRHLGVQFDIDPDDIRNDAVVQAYRTMSGGPTDVG